MAASRREMEMNRLGWNQRVPIHAASREYNVEGFKSGRSSLMSIELEEVGGVSGASLLHLQCHFGLDTMSWSRLGAKATGVDFAEDAVELARRLAAELGLDTRFVLSNIYDLPGVLEEPGSFDVVFTSYGALVWLPDLAEWARVAAHFLKPGGSFHVIDRHPASCIFDDESHELRVRYPYFGNGAMESGPGPSYAGDGVITTPSYEWTHPLSEVVNSLTQAGLVIDFLHEFPFICYRARPAMEQGEDGWWRLPHHNDSIPWLFSIKAHKPDMK